MARARLVFEGSGTAPHGIGTGADQTGEHLALIRSRLALVAVVLGGVSLAGFVLRIAVLALQEEGGSSGAGLGARALGLAVVLGCCGAMFWFARTEQGSAKTVLIAGLGFEVVIAALIAFPQYGLGAHPVTDPMAPSWLAVWIVLFPLVVPARPTKHLVASVLAASTAPLCYLVGSSAGLHPTGFSISWLTIIAPTGFAVILSHFPARIVHQTQEVVREARRKARSAGSYTLEKRIGEGGMGEVWRARHAVLPRPAAVKLIRPEMLSEQDEEEARIALARFQQEAEVTAQLESPHTIELYDYGVTDDGAFYYVMELLTGLDLEELVELKGPIAPARVIYMMRQVCKSLYEAHTRGLVHRDIKPGNIYCCRVAEEYDVMKVLDFGLVKRRRASGQEQSLGLTGQGFIVGTAVTMSPEQAQGFELDARSDIYALGCVMYFLLTGSHVFGGNSAVEVILNHLKTDPIRPSKRMEGRIPSDLEEVVLACLEKEPEDRPADALELSIKLAACDLARPWTSIQARRWWIKHLPDKVGGSK